MSEIDETEWRARTFGTGKPTALPGILAVANAPTWGEAEEERAARAAAAAAAEKREKIAALDAANDHPLAKRAAFQAEAGESRTRIADLQEQLSRARQDHERIEANLAYYDRVVGEIQTAAAPPLSDDPIEQANRIAHEFFRETTRAKVAAMQAGTPRQARRPFSAGGEVRRSEFTCAGCKAEGIDAETSFLIHSDPDRHPGLDAEIDFYPDPDNAERRRVRGSYAREISR